MTNEKVDAIIKAVDSLAYTARDYRKHYGVDAATAQFKPLKRNMETAQ